MTNYQQYERRVLVAVHHILTNAKTRREYVQALTDFLVATSELPVSRLEYWERTFRNELWYASQRDQQSWLRMLGIPRRRILIPWLDCCSSDGFQRERALCASSEGAPNGFLFALVLRRLNDWVPQVRAAARQRVRTMAASTKPRHIVDALWGTLPHLASWGRLQDEDLKVLISLLSIPGVPLELRSKIIETTAGPAALVLAQAGRQSALDAFLPIISEKAIQPAVRAMAYRSQLEGCMVWVEGRKWLWTDVRWCKGKYEAVVGVRKIDLDRPFLEAITMAARDRSPMVRRVAGDALIARLSTLGTDAVRIAEALADDLCPSVAERGKFALAHIDA